MRDRILYIDGLKGFLILFVIYYHILWAAVKFQTSPTVDIFDTICMQLFFLVSGFLLGSSNEWYKVPFKKFVKNKAINILIPTILMFVFSIVYFQLDILYWLRIEFKNGYWFTYILFFFFIIQYVAYTFNDKYKLNRYRFELFLLLFAAIGSLLHIYVYRFFDYSILHFVSFQFIIKFYFFFLLGYLWKVHHDLFDKIMSNNFVVGIMLVISFIPTHLIQEGKIRILCMFIVSICRVVIIFQLFIMRKYFSSNSIISNQIRRFGRHSLEIYFLHYYFIFGIPGLLTILKDQQIMYVIRGAGATFTIEFLAILPISVFVAVLCVLLREITKISPFLSKLFFGPIPKD